MRRCVRGLGHAPFRWRVRGARVLARCDERASRRAGRAKRQLSRGQNPCRRAVRGADHRPQYALRVPSKNNRRTRRGPLLPRPVLVLAAVRAPRPISLQRRNALPRLRDAGGASALHRRDRRHVFRGVGTECPPGQRGRRFQRLGRSAALHALAGRIWSLGTVHPRGGRGRPLQVRNPQPHRRRAAQERSLCLCGRATAAHCFRCLPERCVRLARRRMDGRATGTQLDGSSPRHLRGTSRLLASQRRCLSRLSHTISPIGPPRGRTGLYPHRANAGSRTSLRWLVGLSRNGVFRPERALWHARGFRLFHRLLPSPRNWRDSRLGARALSQRRPRLGPVRRHQPLRTPRPAPRASIPIGTPAYSTTAAPKSAPFSFPTPFFGSSAFTSTACGSMP